MIPMRFDLQRAGRTKIGWSDPRTTDGDLYWPERFSELTVQRDEQVLGKFAVASQFQQSPTPRGGGIVLRAWWKVWPPEGQEDSWTTYVPDEHGREVAKTIFPALDYVLLSCDTAYTEKEENDWSACTVWGSFELNGNPKIILLEAWRERMEMRALVMKILATARRRKADGVLIEAKASGLSVMQEMRRLMRDGEFTIFSEVPRGDKVARLHAVVPQFSGGLVYAPDRKWADMVIDEVSSFPRGKHDDLVDCVSAALKKLRDIGVVQHPAEVEAEKLERLFRAGQRSTRLSIEQEYGL
jgi:predicted phage terminase large subunit-like protein